MQKLNCLVIDDEPIARKALKHYIEKIDELHLVNTFKNGLEAKNYLSNHSIDLIFLDINMPLLSGMELLRILKYHPPVIFTTAYSEHALESFEFNVVDYLVKPITFERFLQAVNKAIRFAEKSAPPQPQHLILKEGTSLVKIPIDEINYIEAMQNYVRIHTPQHNYTILMTLKEIMTLLPPTDFCQAHRSYIVQLRKIQRIEGDQIILEGEQVPLSKRNRVEFLRAFQRFEQIM